MIRTAELYSRHKIMQRTSYMWDLTCLEVLLCVKNQRNLCIWRIDKLSAWVDTRCSWSLPHGCAVRERCERVFGVQLCSSNLYLLCVFCKLFRYTTFRPSSSCFFSYHCTTDRLFSVQTHSSSRFFWFNHPNICFDLHPPERWTLHEFLYPTRYNFQE